MIEPLAESVEISWLEFMARFKKEIYPNIFEPQGLTFGEALLVWEVSNLRNEVIAFQNRLEIISDEEDPEC